MWPWEGVGWDWELLAKYGPHMNAPGCPHDSMWKGKNLSIRSDNFEELGVRCCSKDGSKCYSHGSHGHAGGFECIGASGLSLFQANASCAKVGLRLCSSHEMMSGLCCGTGCNLNYHRVWTSSFFGWRRVALQWNRPHNIAFQFKRWLLVTGVLGTAMGGFMAAVIVHDIGTFLENANSDKPNKRMLWLDPARLMRLTTFEAVVGLLVIALVALLWVWWLAVGTSVVWGPGNFCKDQAARLWRTLTVYTGFCWTAAIGLWVTLIASDFAERLLADPRETRQYEVERLFENDDGGAADRRAAHWSMSEMECEAPSGHKSYA